jgi:hypothetical protein
MILRLKIMRALFFQNFKTISILVLSLFLQSISFAQNVQVDILDTVPETLNLEKDAASYKNKSIMSCGAPASQTVYTLTDVEIILSISNLISKQKVDLTTNWNEFVLPTVTTRPGQELNMQHWPADLQRIVFICFAWNESSRLGLFKPSAENLQKFLKTVREQKPWSAFQSPSLNRKVERMSDDSLLLFIEMVVRTNLFTYSRGDLGKNQSLWYIPLHWL